MQRLGQDSVHMTFTNPEGQLLHLTSSGHFQFGHSKDKQIVTSLEQVKGFGAHVEKIVTEWLGKQGPAVASQEKADTEMAQRGAVAPGSLDAMAESLGPDVKTRLFMLLRAALGGSLTEADLASLKGMAPADPAELVLGEQEIQLPDRDTGADVPDGTEFAMVAGGVMLSMPDGRGGIRERFIAGAHLEQNAAGILLHQPNRPTQFYPNEQMQDEVELVGAGVGASAPPILKPSAKEIGASKARQTRKR